MTGQLCDIFQIVGLPARINDLVQHFEQHIDSFKSGNYNETRARIEFIDPFFKELGWDMENSQGFAEAYKDVIHEDAIKVEGSTKAPDYSFRIGGQRKFFLEAKKPSVNLKEDVGPAYQLRRYAWNAGLPVSILTDFEEFAIYDTTIRPNTKDKASTARIFYCTYKDYTEKWDYIASIFSKDAILKGSFDQFLKDAKKKKGTTAVDKEFLKEMEKWRTDLAKNIALRNTVEIHALNYVVQATIDRILFLRICEDRNIEEYGRLQKLAGTTNIYKKLTEIFEQADEKYNSGLFHFHKEKDNPSAPDEISLRLKIDDKILKEIITALYYPSPYEFSVISADILGNVYEQFLGKVIRLTTGGQAKVEEKPEVKKAGGVYYTPQYIVKYIVENTVGELLKNKTPMMIAGKVKGHHPFRILDPACGSGSFLIYAYQYLLDWHRDWYEKDIRAKGAAQAKKWSDEVYQGPGNHWYLTTREKKRILVNSIFGVDIDHQAVEVTKLNLLLKVLEGENRETLGTNLKLFQERALPDLAQNIKCGNSVIGPDFYQQQLIIDDENRFRINVFDWQSEFPEVMKLGGFDAIIGNPPYVRQESLSDSKSYFSAHYEAFDGVADLYAYMMERSVKNLREGGLFSYIVSSSFLRTTFAEPLRRTLKKYAAVLKIVDFGGLAVFADAKDTYVCIPLLSKGKQPKRVQISNIPSLEVQNLSEYVAANSYSIPHERLSPNAWVLKSDEETSVFEKLMKVGKPLGDYVERKFFRGVTSGLNNAFVIDSTLRRALISKDKRSAELIKPLLGGENIRHYFLEIPDLWLIFTRRGVDINQYPAIREHLEKFKTELSPKKSPNDKVGRKPGRYQWYEIQDDVAYYPIFEGPKIIFPDICKGPRFFLDRNGAYLANTAYCLGVDDPYLLGILNSKLFWFLISNISIPFGVRAGEYRYRLIYQYMEKVPIRVIDKNNKADKTKYDAIINLVDQMLTFSKKNSSAKTDHEQTTRHRQIDALDKQIDRLVYDLYGLTVDEIKIVEGAGR